MPHENHAAIDEPRLRCWTCNGVLSRETTIDLHRGFSFQVLLCVRCGRPWPGGESPRPVIAA
jgi:uncharacterized protein with PIN domain